MADAFSFLNEALAADQSQTRRRARLARASSMHALSALHAAANTALWSAEATVPKGATLAQKFERVLHDLQPEEVLTDAEIVCLHELEIISQILNQPQVAQARDYPHPERDDLIEFDRTPFKCLSHDITTWPPVYAGVVLGMVNGFLGEFFLKRCKCSPERISALFGNHASSDTHYVVAFDRQLLKELKMQEQIILDNSDFIRHMASARWKIPTSHFVVSVLDGCWQD